MQIHVQFKDESAVVVVAVFGCAQDPYVFPNQGILSGDDPRYLAFTEPTLQVPQRIAALLKKVDAHLDAGAALRRYDDIRSAALRAGYPGPFHDEGVVYATWMDACYAKCYQVLAQWEAGTIEEPTAEELIAMLPVLTLPD